MNFASKLSLSSIKRKPFRAAAMAVLVMFLSFTVFIGAVLITSLQNGLSSYRSRLGADIVVVPYSATSHGAVDDILLQGITGNYYMTSKQINKICATEGIEAATTQFFLTSAKASCCSTRVQIIGFDPETDFVISPWVSESYSGTLNDGEIIAGFNIQVPSDRMVKFYGVNYYVVAQLAETGTGLDSAVYTNMNTIRQMAENASITAGTDAFDGVNISTAASAVMIKVADGYEISDVADDINIHISKVEATASRTMIADISAGLDRMSGIIGGLVAAIWVLTVIILVVVFALVSNERKKEFAVLRVMGASQKMLARIMSLEAAYICGVGALVGVILAAVTILPVSSALKSALDLPIVIPGTGTVVAFGAAAFLIAVLVGMLTAMVSARKITASETGLLLREDT